MMTDSACPITRSHRRFPSGWAVLLASSFALASGHGAADGFQAAPTPIPELLSTPAPPVVSFNPERDRMLVFRGERHPPLADLAEPVVRLAGLRLNPLNNGPHRTQRCLDLTLTPVTTGRTRKIPLAANSRISPPVWSPDGKLFAYARFVTRDVELWIGDSASGSIRRACGGLNAAYGEAFHWMPDSQTLLCQTVVTNRGRPPVPPRVATGPLLEETSGKLAPARTYPDLLATPHDVELFDYYLTAQLALINVRSGQTNFVGRPGIFAELDVSPDGRHLLVSRIGPPYSYQLPISSFPREVEVWDLSGQATFKVASLPLADEVPLGGARAGPRAIDWRATSPATLVWVEALDGGDPRQRVPHRDRLMTLSAPFKDAPAEWLRLEHRFAGLLWSERPDVALVREFQSSRRWSRTWVANAETPAAEPRLLWDLSAQDRYNDPGSPMIRPLPNGRRAIRLHRNTLFLAGQGATADGDRPFLDALDLSTLKADRLFQSDELGYESVVAFAKPDASEFITRRESPVRPANYFLRTLASGTRQPLTDFTDLMPQLRGVRKQLVTYQRADGVPLSFTLYLPADHQPGQQLPAILWAYPRDFNEPDLAGQISGSVNRYNSFSGATHLFLVTQGYAVIDGATMPVIGDPRKANDTFLEQIISSARAAVDKAVEMGVVDVNRIGVGGHSYGASMVVNLLAHTDMFRAGVARSGAYNRTLTPFGFQNERRTLWEAPEVYARVSPFMFAQRITEPLLLIHGEADDNPGTFPLQSDRLYQAIKGNGGTARLALLPYEAHNYEARESVEHVIWETVRWFDRHVKSPPAAAPVTVPTGLLPQP